MNFVAQSKRLHRLVVAAWWASIASWWPIQIARIVPLIPRTEIVSASRRTPAEWR
jgi:hypothetical protein